MARLPQVSGKRLIAMLKKIGYAEARRRGSHVRLTRTTGESEHHITVPDHRALAKGTLSDILAAVSIHTGKSRDELVSRLKGR